MNWNINKDYKELCTAVLQDSLASLRAKAGLSQEEISSLIGMTRQTYHALETGKQQIPWTTFLAFAFFFRELDATREMIGDLRIFPAELFFCLNGQIPRRDING